MSSSNSTSSLGDVASIVEYETCRYRHCDDTYPVGETDAAPYCSPTCRRRADASGLMDDIRHDPRFCANSFHQIKEVYEEGRHLRSRKVIAKRWRVKYPNRKRSVQVKSPGDPCAQFKLDSNRDGQSTRIVPTKYTQKGVTDPPELSDPHPNSDYQTAMDGGESTICTCGVGHHTTTVRPIRGVDEMVKGHASRLSSVLDVLHREGEAPPHDSDTLLDEVRARKTDPTDHTPDQHILINAMAEALQFDTDDNTDDTTDHEHDPDAVSY